MNPPFGKALIMCLSSLFVYLGIPGLIFYGLWVQPLKVAVPLTAYYIYVFATKSHLTGTPWLYFTENNPMFKSMREYFSFEVHICKELKPENMSPSDVFVFGIHPHGCVSEFRVFLDNVTRKIFPNLHSWRALAASVVFHVPVLREVCLWTHGIDASKPVAERALRNGHSLVIVPGGEAEQMLTSYQKEIVFLKKRKGFVKLALKHGAAIVPVYVFGNGDLYKTSDFMLDFRMNLMKKYHVALPIYYGPYGLPFVPFQVPLNVVFGKPLGPYPIEEKPSQETVDRVHSLYISELQKVFEENKAKFGFQDRKLTIL